jgi:hypothetical protein
MIRESAYLSDAVCIVVLAALDLLSVVLVVVALHNMFVLRDEWGCCGGAGAQKHII